MNSKTALLLIIVIIILFSGGCQNNATVSTSPTPTTSAISTKSSTPEAAIGEPITVSSPESVKTVAVKTSLPEPSTTQGQLLLPTSTLLVKVSATVLATKVSATSLPAGTLTSKPTPTPTPQAITMPTLSATDNNLASPTPVLYPTTTWRPPSITAADVPDNWLTYVDEEAGYSFKYPPEFYVSAGINKGDKYKSVSVAFLPSKELRPWMTITVKENTNNISTEQYLIEKYINFTKQPTVPAEYLAALEAITINGFPAVWSKADGISEVFIVINAQGKFFNFFISNGIIVSDLRTVDDASKDMFYQIVNTFTLLPK